MNSYSSQKITIRPPYPPVITAQDLIPTNISSNKVESVRIPNAFIAYRMALVRQLKSQKVVYHRSNVSSLASRLWAEEPEEVKNTYRKMATDAQMLHNQARGLIFFSYEQSTSSNNIMQDGINSENIKNTSTEGELFALLNLQNLQIQPSLQQGSPMLASSTYVDSNLPSTTFSAFFDHFNNLGNIYNGMCGGATFDWYRDKKDTFTAWNNNDDVNGSLEQRVQILEQQMAHMLYQRNISMVKFFYLFSI
jgi:hypothetical protein